MSQYLFQETDVQVAGEVSIKLKLLMMEHGLPVSDFRVRAAMRLLLRIQEKLDVMTPEEKRQNILDLLNANEDKLDLTAEMRFILLDLEAGN